MTIIGDKNIKELVGRVVSDKMTKTLVVSVEVVKMNKIVKKRFIRHKKYFVHAEDGSSKVGDVVKIRACRPMSRKKRWMFVEVLQSANVA